MRIIKITTLLIGSVLLTNCASIIHGTKQDIAFSSDPIGANLTINGENRGETPALISLKRNGKYTVKMELPGYLPKEISLSKNVDGWFFGNILFGGLIGIIVDASNGAMYQLSPDQVHAEMTKGNVSFFQKNNNVYVALTKKVDPTWEKIGNLQKGDN